MAQPEHGDRHATVRQAIVLLRELLELGQKEQWEAFVGKSGELAGLDYRIEAPSGLDDDTTAQLRADILLAQQLLQQVTQLAEAEREQIARHLVLISNQTKLNATYGQ